MGATAGLASASFARRASAARFGSAGPASVLEFGADPTGAVDSSIAFQAAINTGQAFIPPGNYQIARPLRLHSNTVVIGRPGALLKSTIAPGEIVTNSLFCALPTYLGSTTLAVAAEAGTDTITVSSIDVSGGPISVGSFIVVFYGLGSPYELRCATYQVTAVSSLSITLDRPLIAGWPSGAPVVLATNVPENIRVLGQGMRLTGTGWRYWEMIGSHRCVLSDVICDMSGGSLQADYACSFDVGGWDNEFDRVRVDADGVCLGGLVLESQERSRVRDCEASNARIAGIFLEDCFACSVTDCSGCGNTTGSGVLVADDDTALGSIQCRIIGGTFSNNTYGIAVSSASSGTQIIDAMCQYNSAAGLFLSADGAPSSCTTMYGVSSTNNAGVGLLVDAGVTGTVASALDLSNNGGSPRGSALRAGTGTDIRITNLTATGLGSYGLITGGDLDVSYFLIESNVANNILVSNINSQGPAPSQVRLFNGQLQIDGDNSIGVLLVTPGDGTSIVHLTQTQIAGAAASVGGTGLVVVSGCSASVGMGCDLSACATPIDVVGTGTVQLAQSTTCVPS